MVGLKNLQPVNVQGDDDFVFCYNQQIAFWRGNKMIS